MNQTPKKKKVQVWVHCRGGETAERLFLLLKTCDRRGGFWQPVTGGVDEGEALEDAAVREFEEETGLRASTPPKKISYTFEFEAKGEKIQEYGFSIEVPPVGASSSLLSGALPDFGSSGSSVREQGGRQQGPPVRLDPNEHSDYQWLEAKEALKRVAFPSNAEMLKCLLSVI